MFGLLMRLSALDADAASAVRVIGFFDALVEHGARIEVVLRQTAMLAECPVGARTADGRLSERVTPTGPVRYGEPPPGARTYRLPSGGEVWLERNETPHPLDDLLIERFALAAGVALGPGHREIAGMDSEALLRLAMSAVATQGDRLRALDRLGVPAESTVHLAAVAGPPAGVEEIGKNLAVRSRTRAGDVEVLLCCQQLPECLAIPVNCRVAAAAPRLAADLPEAWREARSALRFTLPSKHPDPPYAWHEAALVRFEEVGGFAAVAEALSAEQISRVPDVTALDNLAGQPGGEEMIHTLEVVAATESLRRAAAVLHLHHNSVAHRIARAEQLIGYSVSSPYARSRLTLALVLRRIRASAVQF